MCASQKEKDVDSLKPKVKCELKKTSCRLIINVIYYAAHAIFRPLLIDFHNVWKGMETTGCQEYERRKKHRDKLFTKLNYIVAAAIKKIELKLISVYSH